MLHVNRRGRSGDELPQVREAAHLLQASLGLQLPGDGDLVDSLLAGENRQARRKAELVSGPVKVLRLDYRRHAMQRVAVDEQRAQHRGLGLKVVGQLPFAVRVGNHGAPVLFT